MAVWYAQNGAPVNFNHVSGTTISDVWYSTAAGTGGAWLDLSSNYTADTFAANGKTGITINLDLVCAKISTAVETGSTIGGTFLFSGTTARAMTFDIQAGSTVCLSCTHTTGRLTITAASAAGFVGGSSANAYGLYLNSSGPVTINAYNATWTTAIGTGGSNTSCAGITLGSSCTSSSIIVNGSLVGGTASTNCMGMNVSGAATISFTGNTTGGSGTSTTAHGLFVNTAATITIADEYTITAGSAGTCNNGVNNSAAATITIGACNLVDTAYGSAISGKHVYNPAVTNYITKVKTAGTNKLAIEPAAGDVKSGVHVGDVTGTLASGAPSLLKNPLIN